MISLIQSYLPSKRDQLIVLGWSYVVSRSLLKSSKTFEVASVAGLICLASTVHFIAYKVIEDFTSRSQRRGQNQQSQTKYQWAVNIRLAIHPLIPLLIKKGFNYFHPSSPPDLEFLGLYYLAISSRMIAFLGYNYLEQGAHVLNQGVVSVKNFLYNESA